MKTTFLKLFITAVVLLSVSACNKNSNSKSNTELITQKPWIQANVEKGTGGKWQTDEDFTSLEACEKDDQTIFGINRYYEVNEGASNCDASTPQISDKALWEFKDDETKLVIDGEIGTIEKLNETTLIVTYSAAQTGTVNYKFIFKH